MKIGALVPARIGSKRLPKKNIRILGKKPLVCWTIDVLLESDMFTNITVSTDSDEIIDTIRPFYNQNDVQFIKRPAELSEDDSPLTAVKAHYLENFPEIEWIGLFMPTFPFRKIQTLREIHSAILSGYPWKVQTYSTKTYPIMDYYYPVDGGVKRFFNDPCFYARMNRCTYMFERRDTHTSLWTEYGLTTFERVHVVHADEIESHDIDNEDDFFYAAKICKGFMPTQRPLVTSKFHNWRFIAPHGTDFQKLYDFISDKLISYDYPILILKKANPPLSFLSLSDGAQRRPWISPDAAERITSEKADYTGNMTYIPINYQHDFHYRIQRDLGKENFTKLLTTDCWGGLHGIDNSTIPDDRVISQEDLIKQNFYLSPYTWSR